MGVILGTAAYMAPEQARGKAIDKRADVWAFGCVLYEMLTGVRVFGGDEITDTLAFVITKEPDWTALPPFAKTTAFSAFSAGRLLRGERGPLVSIRPVRDCRADRRRRYGRGDRASSR